MSLIIDDTHRRTYRDGHEGTDPPCVPLRDCDDCWLAGQCTAQRNAQEDYETDRAEAQAQ